MATHDIFMGGKGPNGGVAPGTYNAQFFPAVPDDVDAYNRFDARRTPTTGGITRRLVWKRPTGPIGTIEPTSPALAKYLETHTIAAGDFLRIIVLPRRCELVRVWWAVEKPLAGMDFNIDVEGLAPSVGATVPLTTTPISAAAAATGLIDVQAQNGGNPLYIDGNDFLRVELVNLPPSGIADSDIRITAIVRQFEFGGN